ncbi:MAG TPA: hypothetical protein VM285_12580 [Polyangia bacterium]|nr:hypothetical protein [Polyangia bacterium]
MTVEQEGDKEDEVFKVEFKPGTPGKVTRVEIDIARPPLEGVWKVKSSCTAAKLDASLQFNRTVTEERRKAVGDAMVGTDLNLPDLDLGKVARTWKVQKQGDVYVITSASFHNPKSLGGSEYRIRFTGKTTFVGTMESRANFGEKSNIMTANVQGTRVD